MNPITIKEGFKYQTRNGRMVVIHCIITPEEGPSYGHGTLLPLIKGQDETDELWSMTGAYKNGTLGVPHTFDLVIEAGRVSE